MLADPLILADVPKPVRSSITARLKALLDPLATVIVGPVRGAYEERATLYITPGREQLQRSYGCDQRAAQYLISAMIYAPDYPAPEYEMADRLAAQIAKVLATPDATIDALIDQIELTSAEPLFPEEPGALVGTTLTYTITYAADQADPNNPL